MIQRLTRFCVRGVERWLPDPFVLVLLLTLVVFVAGIGIERQRPLAMLEHWGSGFWQLLGFSMQMVLILVTGWVLATTVFVRRILEVHRPAHTLFDVCTVGAGMRTGRGLHVGVSSIVGATGGFSTLQLGADPIGRGAILGRPSGATAPSASRLGITTGLR